ncbi:kinase-associated lipoprotein B [Pontibacillus salipaludis]|uniref:Kinase-associated lipoprotein B n=1 Tax=Pontibacillus salipaludis TaxID=1697394 RepID=A0ABQ1PYG7_9BACI|nr:kinase-associated lipoprotein B [Pontibacillus salipaludis]GGD06408.1 kinase-associated lipoprotein B [Pontibacillus salipaludis]
MAEFETGSVVKAHYKTGVYAGEIVEDRGSMYLVKVLAVLKHPQQGDLHNPGQTENVFFHQRKALSQYEKANVSKSAVHLYEDEVPSYEDSLKQALNNLKEKLNKKDDDFSKLALQRVDELEHQYFS